MKKIFALSALVLSSHAFADNSYVEATLQTSKDRIADVYNIVVLETKDVPSTDANYGFRQDQILVTFGITARGSACEELGAIIQYGGQAGYENRWNGSDSYIKVPTTWKPDCATGSYGKPENLKFTMAFNYSDPTAPVYKMDATKSYFNKSSVSFDIGMLQGHNRRQLFQIDYGTPEKPMVTLVKTYSDTEGKVLDLRNPGPYGF